MQLLAACSARIILLLLPKRTINDQNLATVLSLSSPSLPSPPSPIPAWRWHIYGALCSNVAITHCSWLPLDWMQPSPPDLRAMGVFDFEIFALETGTHESQSRGNKWAFEVDAFYAPILSSLFSSLPPGQSIGKRAVRFPGNFTEWSSRFWHEIKSKNVGMLMYSPSQLWWKRIDIWMICTIRCISDLWNMDSDVCLSLLHEYLS